MIVKAGKKDIKLLADIGRISFIESHGSSTAEKDINTYVKQKYTVDVLKGELNDPKNSYYIIYHNKQAAGYSKIVLNSSHPNISSKNVSKLERIYLLKEFYSLKLGAELLNFNIDLSKQNGRSGMWLFVWKENVRAVNFYIKNNFKIIGSHDFKISETHSNPNHQLLLEY